MRHVSALGAALLWLGMGASASFAQYRPYTPPPSVPAVPYTPPTIYAPPRAYEHVQPPPSVVIPPPTVVVPQGRGRNDPLVVVPAPPPPPPPEALPDPVDEVLQELGECAANGVMQIVDCLRQNHNSVMIRRLEACLRSETIPRDGNEVRACLAGGGW